jgi:hypothetical protein
MKILKYKSFLESMDDEEEFDTSMPAEDQVEQEGPMVDCAECGNLFELPKYKSDEVRDAKGGKLICPDCSTEEFE